MTVNELITQLQNFDPDLEVKCMTVESDWIWDGECSVEVDKGAWQDVGGVELVGCMIKIYSNLDDVGRYF